MSDVPWKPCDVPPGIGWSSVVHEPGGGGLGERLKINFVGVAEGRSYRRSHLFSVLEEVRSAGFSLPGSVESSIA